jgi:hypothetical protein
MQLQLSPHRKYPQMKNNKHKKATFAIETPSNNKNATFQ